MNSLSLLGGSFCLGLVVLAVELFRAPEASQDEDGFHLIWVNDNPSTPNVSCVWATTNGPIAA